MADRQGLPPLSERQLAVMGVVWERGEATVADVWRALQAERPLARNTVLTTIQRLEEKGWLVADASGHAHRYRAAVPRAATLGTMVRRLVETAFAGSAEGLVSALLDGRGVTPTEATRIRALIDRAEAAGQTAPPEAPASPSEGRQP